MRRASSELRGSGSGAVIIAIMGSVWAAIALSGHPALLFFLLPVPLFLVVLGIKFIQASARLRNQEPPPTTTEMAAETALQKRFQWVFAAEGIAIFLAVNVLANIGKNAFLIPTIGIIVGLHFLPLARLYGRALFYGSGAIQILLCLVAAVLLRSNPYDLRTVTSLGMALVLWATMGTVLMKVRKGLGKVRGAAVFQPLPNQH